MSILSQRELAKCHVFMRLLKTVSSFCFGHGKYFMNFYVNYFHTYMIDLGLTWLKLLTEYQVTYLHLSRSTSDCDATAIYRLYSEVTHTLQILSLQFSKADDIVRQSWFEVLMGIDYIHVYLTHKLNPQHKVHQPHFNTATWTTECKRGA